MEKAKLDRESALLHPLRETLFSLQSQKKNIKHEMKTADMNSLPGDPGLSLWIYKQYMQTAKKQVNSLDQRMERVLQEIDKQEKVVRERYAEMKKYEITQEKLLNEKYEEEEKKEFIESEDMVQSRYALKTIN